MSKIVQLSIYYNFDTFTDLILSTEPNFRSHYLVIWAAQN